MKIPLETLSLVWSLVNIFSVIPMTALSAGTKLPMCAM